MGELEGGYSRHFQGVKSFMLKQVIGQRFRNAY
jgi:hypothetical protein